MQRTNTNLMTDVVENIGLKLLFQSWFSIQLVLLRLYRKIISMTKTMIASLLSLLFCINFNLIYNVYPTWIFSVLCVNGVDWKRIFNPVFDDVCKKLASAHCTVTSNTVFWLWQMKLTNDLYFQSCQLMFCCLSNKKQEIL